MAQQGGILDKVLLKRELRRWAQIARDADAASAGDLRKHVKTARQFKTHIDQVLDVANRRLTQPEQTGEVPKAFNADWAWRPDIWCRPIAGSGMASVPNQTSFGASMTVFHDCPFAALSLRQTRKAAAQDGPLFGLCMDVMQFDGSFLSWVVNLPDPAAEELKQSHILRMDCVTETEAPGIVLARINIKHGPNTEQVLHELTLSNGTQHVEFDLAYTKLNEKRVEKVWVDLIFENPEMTSVTFRDMTFTRRPRAAL